MNLGRGRGSGASAEASGARSRRSRPGRLCKMRARRASRAACPGGAPGALPWRQPSGETAAPVGGKAADVPEAAALGGDRRRCRTATARLGRRRRAGELRNPSPAPTTTIWAIRLAGHLKGLLGLSAFPPGAAGPPRPPSPARRRPALAAPMLREGHTPPPEPRGTATLSPADGGGSPRSRRLRAASRARPGPWEGEVRGGARHADCPSGPARDGGPAVADVSSRHGGASR